VNREAADRRFGRSALRCLGLALALGAGTALAADEYDRIVVRVRDEVASTSSADALQRLGSALRGDFHVVGRGRDGSYELELAAPLSLDDARAALNRVRLDPDVVYANLAPVRAPLAAPSALHPKDAVGRALPTNQLVVKYRDAARRQALVAGASLTAPEVAQLATLAGAPVAYARSTFDGASVLQLPRRLPADVVLAMAQRIAALPEVEWAQPDYMQTIALTPNDPCYASASVAGCNNGFQWDLFNTVGGVNAPAAWNITTGSSSIRVGVIDTGALFAHPDLSSRLIAGYDMIYDGIVGNDNDPSGLPAICATNPLTAGCSSRDNDASDPGDWVTSGEASSGWLFGCNVGNSSWHGSHVAGTIGASPSNGAGIAGLNWVSSIMPVRVLGKCGGYTSDIADAITWASGGTVPGIVDTATPARVLNLSIGGFSFGQTCDSGSPLYNTAITGAISRGAVVVIAAGNSNYNAAYSPPGNCPGVITVAATGELGYKAYYSNWGATVEIAAPGGDSRFHATYNPNQRGILSSINSGTTTPLSMIYAQYQGTSMATPHVVGIVSLMLSANPALTPAQVLSKIQVSSRSFQTGAPACDTSNVPDSNGTGSVSSGSWFACTCTTALCGAGFIDAYRAVQVAIGMTSTTAVGSSLNPALQGAAVTFTATVAGIVPAGSVTFTDNGTAIPGCSNVALVGSGDSRTAPCTTSSLTAGAHSIVATYASSDTNNTSSASSALSESITSTAWLGFLGGSNQATGAGSGVAAGSFNSASAQGSFVGAGTSNQAAGISSLVIGGFDNHGLAIDSFVGAGAGNRASGPRAVVVGGGYNLASGPWSFIGGGGRETGSGSAGASLEDHVAVAKWAAIGGGNGNRAGASAAQTGATIAGGEQNQALNTDATVIGGAQNFANAAYATVIGGQGNTAPNTAATIGGGVSNAATGQWPTVPGGNSNVAGGNYSFAAGRQAKVSNAGSMALADASPFDFFSAANNQFAVRAVGGVRVVTAVNGAGAPTAGVTVAAGGGAWSSLSDRAAKQDLARVDGDAILAKVVTMPVYTWRYKTEASQALHMGPTAQDFHGAFGLGDTDTRITNVDADGIALAAIHALQQRAEERAAAIASRAARIAVLRARIAATEATAAELAIVRKSLADLLRSVGADDAALRTLGP